MKKIFVMMFALLTGIGAAHAQEQVLEENIDEFVKNDEYFKIHPDDISQIDHEDYDDERQ